MKLALSEILKMADQFPMLKVVGTATETKFLASSECKKLIFQAVAASAVPDFEGEFGISSMKMLRGLLNLPAYQNDKSTFSVKRRTIGDREIVEQFDFAAGKGSRSSATFRLTSPDLIGEITSMTGKPVWDVEFEPDREKINEFAQLAALYGEVSKTFTVSTDSGELIFNVGNHGNSSQHSASMIFQTDVTGSVVGDIAYPSAMFLGVMKLAATNPVRLSIKSKTGPMKIEITTELATYTFYLRGARA